MYMCLTKSIWSDTIFSHFKHPIILYQISKLLSPILHACDIGMWFETENCPIISTSVGTCI